MAMIVTLLLVVVIMGVSGVIASTLAAQSPTVLSGNRSTKSLQAAKAGLQAAIGQLRADSATVNGVTVGNPSTLPCGAGSNPVLSGSVDGTTSLTYQVTISYQNALHAAMSCPFPANVNMTGSPSYAVVQSTGVASFGGQTTTRTLHAVYTLLSSNINIAGGLIEDSSLGYCIVASSANVGASINFKPLAQCTNSALDAWVYSTGYQLQLASTILGSAPLCITGASTGNATLTSCVANQWSQLWSWTGKYTWYGQQNPITNGNSNWALTWSGSLNSSPPLQVVNAPSDGPGNTFVPTPAVGAGGASAATNEIVNYQQFGRCLDVTQQKVSMGYDIVYPCKQDPSGQNNIFWNQKFSYTEASGSSSSTTTTVSVYDNNNNQYCLTSLGTAGGYTPMKSCNGSAAQQWTRYYNTGTYSASYLFVDYAGRCLDVAAIAANGTYPTVVTNACSGNTSQKWNALPNPGTTSLFNYLEGAS